MSSSAGKGRRPSPTPCPTAVDQLVSRILSESGEPLDSPPDLRRLLQTLGIALRFEALPGAQGAVRLEAGRPMIIIERRLTASRTQFTLGHELGHWALAAYPQETRAIWTQRPFLRDPERFCDEFAASLLLPFRWACEALTEAQEVHNDVLPLDVLLWMARVANVSPHAAVIRATRVARWKRLLLHVSWSRARWRVLGASGYHGVWRSGVALTAQSERQVAALMASNDPDEIERGPSWHAVMSGGAAYEAPGELRRLRRSAFLCIAPDRARTGGQSVQNVAAGERPRSGT